MTRERKQRAQRYRKRLAVAFGPAEKAVASGFTTNVSATGFGLTTSNPQPRGTQLFLTLTLPSREVARVQGQVAWTMRAEPALGRQGVMGIRLLNADETFFRFLVIAAGVGG